MIMMMMMMMMMMIMIMIMIMILTKGFFKQVSNISFVPVWVLAARAIGSDSQCVNILHTKPDHNFDQSKFTPFNI